MDLPLFFECQLFGEDDSQANVVIIIMALRNVKEKLKQEARCRLPLFAHQMKVILIGGFMKALFPQ